MAQANAAAGRYATAIAARAQEVPPLSSYRHGDARPSLLGKYHAAIQIGQALTAVYSALYIISQNLSRRKLNYNIRKSLLQVSRSSTCCVKLPLQKEVNRVASLSVASVDADALLPNKAMSRKGQRSRPNSISIPGRLCPEPELHMYARMGPDIRGDIKIVASSTLSKLF